MASLMLAVAAAALPWTADGSAAEPVDRWSAHVAEASTRFGIPRQWIRRVIQLESAGRTHLRGRPIASRAGALGLMQLMPRTWLEISSSLGLGPDPHDPRDNIMAGTFYLRLMYDRFGYPGLFAAYNAGPGRYGAYLSGHAPLPAETRAYVAAVAGPARGHPRKQRAMPANLYPDQVRGMPAAAIPKAIFAESLFVPLSGEGAR